MDSFFTRFKNPLILIAILLVQVIALAVQVQPTVKGPEAASTTNSDGKKVTMLRHWTTAVVTPVERGFHATSQGIRGAWADYVDLRHTRQRNEQLQGDIARLRVEQAAFAEDAAEGRRLQKLLDFQQQYIATTVAAQVIGTSGSDRSNMLILDKGSKDGLKPEQAVMTPDGVVGKLRDVFPHTSQLLLLSDSTSGAGVILVSSRIRGILRGSTLGGLQINNLTSDSRIKVGEKVVTSGGDMVFPRGLPVGEIEKIDLDPQHQPYTMIRIRPAANLQQLGEVLVITGTQSTLPPAAQQDAAIAEGTAAANDATVAAAAAAAKALEQQRAADMIAEKLPSLHPETNADGTPVVDENQTGGISGVPNSGLPKPRAVLRPDRYSPGTTPSAQDLKPGSPVQPQEQAPRVSKPQAAKPQTVETAPPQG